MKRFLIFLTIAIGVIMTQACSCTVIDNSEVGIKFKKFGLTDQGKLEAESVSGRTQHALSIKFSLFRSP